MNLERTLCWKTAAVTDLGQDQDVDGELDDVME